MSLSGVANCGGVVVEGHPINFIIFIFVNSFGGINLISYLCEREIRELR